MLKMFNYSECNTGIMNKENEPLASKIDEEATNSCSKPVKVSLLLNIILWNPRKFSNRKWTGSKSYSFSIEVVVITLCWFIVFRPVGSGENRFKVSHFIFDSTWLRTKSYLWLKVRSKIDFKTSLSHLSED